ncbi:hypothetical protein GF373_12620 [bacterium]|nr:hypothetical protein [bacterium]
MDTLFDTRHTILIVLVVLITCVPFLDKAYHIDDTFVLAITENIIENPLDPMGGDIDWTGETKPILTTTTNPPFISYYLAPFALLSDYNEIVLHAGMMLFILLYGLGAYALTKRFSQGSLFPVLFVLTSPAVMVSGNVMRDTPALGLATLGLALFIYGVDSERRPYLFLGSIFAGLAILTKYSAIIMLPVYLVYVILNRKYRLLIWVWPMLALILTWCLHNQVIYGKMHMVYLAMLKHHMTPKPWDNKLSGGLMLFGSILYLAPFAVYGEFQRSRWLAFFLAIGAGVATFYGVQTHHGWKADGEYLFWAVTGGITVFLCLLEGIRRGLPYLLDWNNKQATDSLFLFAWFCAPFLFSILLVPFQAVRHLLMALLPLTLLAFQTLDRQPSWSQVGRRLCIGLLLIQTLMGFAVHYADCDYANTYREFAAYAKKHWTKPNRETWYIGHWGWKFYADRAGFRQIHYNGEFPQKGDILLWPQYVHTGTVFMDDRAFQDSLQPIETQTVLTFHPIRTMNRQGAKFYATIWIDTPYRLYQPIPLDTMRVFLVTRDYQPSNK